MNTKKFAIYIGSYCKKFRHMLGYTQQEVAFQLGTTRENIAKFESGQNRNYIILLWYVLHDMKINEVVTSYVNEGKRNLTVK